MKEIEIYLKKSEDDLYADLAVGILNNDLNILPLSKSELVQRGKQIFKKKLELSKKEFVVVASLIKLKNDKNKLNDAEIVLAIAEMIADLTIGFSPIPISTIVVKMGLKKLCPDKNQ